MFPKKKKKNILLSKSYNALKDILITSQASKCWTESINFASYLLKGLRKKAIGMANIYPITVEFDNIFVNR